MCERREGEWEGGEDTQEEPTEEERVPTRREQWCKSYTNTNTHTHMSLHHNITLSLRLEARTTVVEGAPPPWAPPPPPWVPRAMRAARSWENAKQNSLDLIK